MTRPLSNPEAPAEIGRASYSQNPTDSARDKRICGLLYSARSVAGRNIQRSPDVLPDVARGWCNKVSCSDCGRSIMIPCDSSDWGLIPHTAMCQTGRILELLDLICTSVEEPAPAAELPSSEYAEPWRRMDDRRKPGSAALIVDANNQIVASIPWFSSKAEEICDRIIACVNLGASVSYSADITVPKESKSNPHRACNLCGSVDDNWDVVSRRGVEVDLRGLRLNECVSASSELGSHDLWTHRCAAPAAAGAL